MSIGKESQLVDTLKHLVALDYDAISAYQAAVDRLESSRYRRALREFMTDHWRRNWNWKRATVCGRLTANGYAMRSISNF